MSITLLFFESIAIGIIITFIFELILKSNKKLRERYYVRHEILFGYHVHHSTIGAFLVIGGGPLLFFQGTTSYLIIAGIGLGIIIQHTLSSRRFVFIEKETFSKKARKKRK